MRKNLRAIYEGADGKLPDFTKLSHKQKSAFRGLLVKSIIVLFALSLIAWTGFLLFSQGFFEQNQTLSISIEGPDSVRAGEEVSYKIRYDNTGDIPLAALEMKLNIPNSFHLISAIPEATEELQWTIGSLTPRSDGAITVTGIFLSEVPSSQRLQTLFTYKPANFSSDFQDIETKLVEIKDSVASLSINGPEKALAGDEITYEINIKNTGKDPIFNLRLLPLLSEDFTLSKSDPERVEGEDFWTVTGLKPGELESISLTGTFTSSANGEIPIGARIGFIADETFLIQSEKNVVTDVLGGAVSFHLIIDGSAEDQTAQPNETLRGSIDFSNTGSDTAEDITFTLSLLADAALPINWEKADLAGGQRDGNSITWTKKEIESLEELESGDTDVIDFSLPLKQGDDQADQFSVKLEALIARVGSIKSTRVIESTPIVISINSDASLSVHARYFSEDNEPLGSGPLPPTVNETTSYRVYWTIDNSLHDLENVEVSTILPQDIVWTDKSQTEIGTITFNQTTKQISWKIPKLPTSVPQPSGWFNLSISPSEQDIGTFLKLTNPTAFEATDSVTQDNITTEIPQDEFAKGKGIVKE